MRFFFQIYLYYYVAFGFQPVNLLESNPLNLAFVYSNYQNVITSYPSGE